MEKLTESEKIDCRTLFEAIDHNKTGTISCTHLKSIFSSFGVNIPQKDFEKICAKYPPPRQNCINLSDFSLLYYEHFKNHPLSNHDILHNMRNLLNCEEIASKEDIVKLFTNGRHGLEKGDMEFYMNSNFKSNAEIVGLRNFLYSYFEGLNN